MDTNVSEMELTHDEWIQFFGKKEDMTWLYEDFRDWIRIEIEPMPTPRPRMRVIKKRDGKSFASVYNDSKYTKYKNDLTKEILALNLKKDDYYKLDIVFFLPYPKSTAKKRRVDSAPHRRKPDKDNFEKAFMDALESSGLIANDGQISDGVIMKRYTTEAKGFIMFKIK